MNDLDNINEIKAQIAQNQLLLSMSNVVGDISLLSPRANADMVLHMAEAAESLSKVNKQLIIKLRAYLDLMEKITQ